MLPNIVDASLQQQEQELELSPYRWVQFWVFLLQMDYICEVPHGLGWILPFHLPLQYQSGCTYLQAFVAVGWKPFNLNYPKKKKGVHAGQKRVYYFVL